MGMICILKNGRFGPYIQYEKNLEAEKEEVKETKKKKNEN